MGTGSAEERCKPIKFILPFIPKNVVSFDTEHESVQEVVQEIVKQFF